jgi:hypothetical protein
MAFMWERGFFVLYADDGSLACRCLVSCGRPKDAYAFLNHSVDLTVRPSEKLPLQIFAVCPTTDRRKPCAGVSFFRWGQRKPK